MGDNSDADAKTEYQNKLQELFADDHMYGKNAMRITFDKIDVKPKNGTIDDGPEMKKYVETLVATYEGLNDKQKEEKKKKILEAIETFTSKHANNKNELNFDEMCGVALKLMKDKAEELFKDLKPIPKMKETVKNFTEAKNSLTDFLTKKYTQQYEEDKPAKEIVSSVLKGVIETKYEDKPTTIEFEDFYDLFEKYHIQLKKLKKPVKKLNISSQENSKKSKGQTDSNGKPDCCEIM